MAVRRLDAFLDPKSIAVLGATADPDAIGRTLTHNLRGGGFKGTVFAVEPGTSEVNGVAAVPSVDDLPMAPDLAVIASPSHCIGEQISQLVQRGTKAAIILSREPRGGNESGDATSLHEYLREAADSREFRIIGPDSMGLIVPRTGLNASFAPIEVLPGDLAFVTQSDAVMTSMLAWSSSRRVGFSLVASLGEMIDVSFGDVLESLVLDPRSRAILLHLQQVTDARRFMSAARAAARIKPIVVCRPRGSRGLSDTEVDDLDQVSLADAVCEAAFRRAGLVQVQTLDEMVAAARTLAASVRVGGNRLAIASNGLGLAQLAADTLLRRGGRLASFTETTVTRLDDVASDSWDRRNPVNIGADAPAARCVNVLEALLADSEVDAVLLVHCPTCFNDPLEVAKGVASAVRSGRKPVFTAWLDDSLAAEVSEVFSKRHISNHDTVDRAIAAFLALARYQRSQEMLTETPPSLPVQFESNIRSTKSVVDRALQEGRTRLTDAEAHSILQEFGIPAVSKRIVGSPEAAAYAADEVGYPVELRLRSAGLENFMEFGGMESGLADRESVRAAGQRLVLRMRELNPEMKADGFTVQSVVNQDAAHELCLKMRTDPWFGPVIVFSQGGGMASLFQQETVTLPPLNMNLARLALDEGPLPRIVRATHHSPAKALDDIAFVLTKLSHLVAQIGEIAEMDIAPLFVGSSGVIAVDVRITLQPNASPAEARLAIRPYPVELERMVRLKDGNEAMIRPIRPEDEPSLQTFFSALSEADIRFRFFAPLKQLEHKMAARMTQIDYDREMSFIVVDPATKDPTVLGLVSLSADATGDEAEYAVTVRSDLKGAGIGRILMLEAIDYAMAQGLRAVHGDVLAENRPMLGLVKKLGFVFERDPDEPGVMRVIRRLRPG